MELITPEALLLFNVTEFSRDNRVNVAPSSPDCTRWRFADPGGVHELTSPGLVFFERLLTPYFEQVDFGIVIATLRQLVARGRRAGVERAG